MLKHERNSATAAAAKSWPSGTIMGAHLADVTSHRPEAKVRVHGSRWRPTNDSRRATLVALAIGLMQLALVVGRDAHAPEATLGAPPAALSSAGGDKPLGQVRARGADLHAREAPQLSGRRALMGGRKQRLVRRFRRATRAETPSGGGDGDGDGGQREARQTPVASGETSTQTKAANKTSGAIKRMLQDERLLQLRQKYMTNRAIDDRDYYILLAIYAALIAFGTISNGLICLTVLLKPKILSPRNIFIVNLAGSDLLLCVFTMPFSFIQISMKMWNMGLIPCKLVSGLQATSIFVSTISITAIALDRYKVIVYPTHQETASSARGVTILLASVWIGALMLSLPLFWFRTVEHVDLPRKQGQIDSLDFCYEDWPFKHGRGIYSVISMIFQYVLPITIVSIVYAKISDKLQKRLIRRQRLTQLECQQKRQLNLIRRTHTMLVSVSLVFGLSWLPLNLLNVIADFSTYSRLFKSQDQYSDQFFRIVFAICHLIGCSSACSNPILYGFLNENFRKEVHQVYRAHFRSLRRNLLRGSAWLCGHCCCCCSALAGPKHAAIAAGLSKRAMGDDDDASSFDCSSSGSSSSSSLDEFDYSDRDDYSEDSLESNGSLAIDNETAANHGDQLGPNAQQQRAIGASALTKRFQSELHVPSLLLVRGRELGETRRSLGSNNNNTGNNGSNLSISNQSPRGQSDTRLSAAQGALGKARRLSLAVLGGSLRWRHWPGDEPHRLRRTSGTGSARTEPSWLARKASPRASELLEVCAAADKLRQQQRPSFGTITSGQASGGHFLGRTMRLCLCLNTNGSLETVAGLEGRAQELAEYAQERQREAPDKRLRESGEQDGVPLSGCSGAKRSGRKNNKSKRRQNNNNNNNSGGNDDDDDEEAKGASQKAKRRRIRRRRRRRAAATAAAAHSERFASDCECQCHARAGTLLPQAGESAACEANSARREKSRELSAARGQVELEQQKQHDDFGAKQQQESQPVGQKRSDNNEQLEASVEQQQQQRAAGGKQQATKRGKRVWLRLFSVGSSSSSGSSGSPLESLNCSPARQLNKCASNRAATRRDEANSNGRTPMDKLAQGANELAGGALSDVAPNRRHCDKCKHSSRKRLHKAERKLERRQLKRRMRAQRSPAAPFCQPECGLGAAVAVNGNNNSAHWPSLPIELAARGQRPASVEAARLHNGACNQRQEQHCGPQVGTVYLRVELERPNRADGCRQRGNSADTLTSWGRSAERSTSVLVLGADEEDDEAAEQQAACRPEPEAGGAAPLAHDANTRHEKCSNGEQAARQCAQVETKGQFTNHLAASGDQLHRLKQHDDDAKEQEAGGPLEAHANRAAAATSGGAQLATEVAPMPPNSVDAAHSYVSSSSSFFVCSAGSLSSASSCARAHHQQRHQSHQRHLSSAATTAPVAGRSCAPASGSCSTTCSLSASVSSVSSSGGSSSSSASSCAAASASHCSFSSLPGGGAPRAASDPAGQARETAQTSGCLSAANSSQLLTVSSSGTGTCSSQFALNAANGNKTAARRAEDKRAQMREAPRSAENDQQAPASKLRSAHETKRVVAVNLTEPVAAAKSSTTAAANQRAYSVSCGAQAAAAVATVAGSVAPDSPLASSLMLAREAKSQQLAGRPAEALFQQQQKQQAKQQQQQQQHHQHQHQHQNQQQHQLTDEQRLLAAAGQCNGIA